MPKNHLSLWQQQAKHGELIGGQQTGNGERTDGHMLGSKTCIRLVRVEVKLVKYSPGLSAVYRPGRNGATGHWLGRFSGIIRWKCPFQQISLM